MYQLHNHVSNRANGQTQRQNLIRVIPILDLIDIRIIRALSNIDTLHTHTTLIYFCIRQSSDDGDAKCLYSIHHTDKWEVGLRSGHTFSRQQKIHLVFHGDFLAKLVNWRQDWIGPLSELPLLISCDECVCLHH